MQPAFPSPVERYVASALLLLSTMPPSSSLFYFDEDDTLKVDSMNSFCCSRNSFKSTDSCSNSSCSLLTMDDGSSHEINASRVNFAAASACCREIKLKVVRKSRSKIQWVSSDCRKFISGTVSKISAGSETTDTSCLSRSSSAHSSAPTLGSDACRGAGERKREMAHKEKLNKRCNDSPYIRRRAQAILKFLSRGCSSEVRIRQLLGDSPDTSKALRMLLRLDEVKRSGTGGRQDPYIYMIAGT